MSCQSLIILLLGSGGREHALAWKLSQSPLVHHVYCVPGNGGTASTPKCTNHSDLPSPEKVSSFPALVSFAQRHGVNFLVPGPEAPLVAGVVDYFEQHAPGVRCFGPKSDAARMEGSKTFAKDFMRKHAIPTAKYQNFSSHASAKQYLETVDHPVVIKASGLAGGKGVIIPSSKDEAQEALTDIMLKSEFGAAGEEVVIEEFLEGNEISILSFSDGITIKSLPPAQDHKRIGDGDTGGNTGGMGAYAPCPSSVVSQAQMEEIERTVLRPTIKGMEDEGYPFRGVLFTGLMMATSGPCVLEYNVRFGDPEVQTLLPLLAPETDLAQVLYACTDHTLSSVQVSITNDVAATVVVAAGGYPSSYPKGTPMKLKDIPEDVQVFHAGTAVDVEGKLKTSGGRVIAATATGKTLKEAVEKAYGGVKAIEFEGMYYRRDIAARALN
ncbi:phosphoribosylamine--glycine ligase [Viridothelium virens]|uniref:phosphoribosylamine--glycine ligase n=1 Tax=Viridothelium virens TaxID=1048519 RepID=A0A6A6HKT7_VIRVR|nr:phosphoribosylamine--glycine ligase [Viridothelium virens]